MNLAAERARFRAKLEAEALRQRARRVLSGRWNLKPKQIPPAVAEMYPDLTPEEQAAVAEMVLEVQVDEAPVRVPVGSVEVRPPEVEGIFGASLANRPTITRAEGSRLGPIFWRYSLTRAAAFLRNAGHELRWYGIAIPWTRYGFGVLVKRPLPRAEER